MRNIDCSIRWRRAEVLNVEQAWPALQQLTCRILAAGAGIEIGGAEADLGSELAVVNYPELTGLVMPGDEVLLNTAAWNAGLGTGGHAIVIAVVNRLPADAVSPGHLIKARYTPLQTMVQGVDEQDSPHHEALRDADSIDGMPVVSADLHSALPAIVAGARHRAAVMGRPAPAVVYVMTDGGALPVAYSRTVAALRAAGWISATVSVGQAYGGDLEAVSVHSALLAARLVADADIAVVAQGPGNLGTGTRWGFSGVSVGETVNAAGILGGRAIGSLRMSGADPRTRHRGISHHSMTAYGRIALMPADIPIPMLDWDAELLRTISGQAEELAGDRHRLIRVSVAGLDEALHRSPIPMVTMGRSITTDPIPFLAAAVAGVRAVDVMAGVS